MAAEHQALMAHSKNAPPTRPGNAETTVQTTPQISIDAHENILRVENLTIRYGNAAAVKNASLDVPARRVTALIGPSGCGKSTLLRALNRMNDFIPGMATDGRIRFHNLDIHGRDCDPIELRRRIGMVFQHANPFPKSIYKNVAWGAAINGYQGSMDDLVERSLHKAALWDEVKDRLRAPALELSAGQQQRLCIARALALEPEVLLMDEPCSALDPVASARIEDLIDKLKRQYTIVLVTHNMQQAARVSDRTAFMLMGEMVEINDTNAIFTRPGDKRTQDYITGRFG